MENGMPQRGFFRQVQPQPAGLSNRLTKSVVFQAAGLPSTPSAG